MRCDGCWDDSYHLISYKFLECFRVFDEDGSGTIDFEEFMMIVNFKSTTYEDKLGENILFIILNNK